jgi:hypothetical protein
MAPGDLVVDMRYSWGILVTTARLPTRKFLLTGSFVVTRRHAEVFLSVGL